MHLGFKRQVQEKNVPCRNWIAAADPDGAPRARWGPWTLYSGSRAMCWVQSGEQSLNPHVQSDPTLAPGQSPTPNPSSKSDPVCWVQNHMPGLLPQENVVFHWSCKYIKGVAMTFKIPAPGHNDLGGAFYKETLTIMLEGRQGTIFHRACMSTGLIRPWVGGTVYNGDVKQIIILY